MDFFFENRSLFNTLILGKAFISLFGVHFLQKRPLQSDFADECLRFLFCTISKAEQCDKIDTVRAIFCYKYKKNWQIFGYFAKKLYICPHII